MPDKKDQLNCRALLQAIGACAYLKDTAGTLDERFAFEKKERELLRELDSRCGLFAAQLASRLVRND
jgi:hypothetical protein